MACHILLCVLCFVDGNDAFPFLGDPADDFELLLVLDSIFGAILSLGFELRCHLQHWLQFLKTILSRGFEFLHRFEHRVRVLVQFFTIAVTGFEFLWNSNLFRYSIGSLTFTIAPSTVFNASKTRVSKNLSAEP